MKESVLHTRAVRISFISIAVNLLLSLLKLIAGLAGNSSAMIADAVHSASDVFTTVIVIASLFVAARKPDSEHEYGHQKYESLAALFLGILLAHVGVKIGISGARSLISGAFRTAARPTAMAAAAAVISVVVKELMFRVTITAAKKERSNALAADAWHHRSDALSSVGSLAGVLFSMNGFPFMDPAAGLVICIFILKTALEIVLDAVKALTDSSCDKKTENAIRAEVLSVPEVRAVDMLKTRVFGSGIYVDLEIAIDRSMSFEEAHRTAEAVHDRIESTFPEVWHCMVHANPAGTGEE